MINSHNKKVLSNKQPDDVNKCNCRQKNTCPLAGKCLERNLVYCGNATTKESDDESNYLGVTQNTIKDRIYKHRNSFKYESKANSTELSKYVWDLKKKGILNPIVKWSIIDHATPYINGSKKFV